MDGLGSRRSFQVFKILLKRGQLPAQLSASTVRGLEGTDGTSTHPDPLFPLFRHVIELAIPLISLTPSALLLLLWRKRAAHPQHSLDLIQINLLRQLRQIRLSSISHTLIILLRPFLLLRRVLLERSRRFLIHHLLPHLAPKLDKAILAKHDIKLLSSVLGPVGHPARPAIFEAIDVESEALDNGVVDDFGVDGVEGRVELGGVGGEELEEGVGAFSGEVAYVRVKESALVHWVEGGMVEAGIWREDLNSGIPSDL